MKEKLVTIARFRYEYRAYLLKDKLIEHGIECALTNESVFRQIDGVMVLVKESDYEKAVEVYSSLRDKIDDFED
ncbi:MAG TPA: DUF2007 domain-containing protein [Bacteroidales bacterium]|nr:DUF2007 domain-containing protein [Bacteroidales bacterium]